jgi:hypothetical protein
MRRTFPEVAISMPSDPFRPRFHGFALTGSDLNQPLTPGFGCGRDRVKKALSHGLEPPETRGRHRAMNDDAEREV